MIRSLLFSLIFGASFGLIYLAAERLRLALDYVSLGAGLLIAAITGWTWFMVNNWWSVVTRPYKKQTITLETKETPAQITNAAFWAKVRGGFIILSALALLTSQLPEIRGIFKMLWENFGFLSR